MYKVLENRYVGEDMYLMRVEGKFESNGYVSQALNI